MDNCQKECFFIDGVPYVSEQFLLWYNIVSFVIVTAQGSRSNYSHALNAAMAPQKSFRLVHLYCILTNENRGFKAMVGVAGSIIIIAAPQCTVKLVNSFS